MSASVYGSPSMRSARMRAAMSSPSSFASFEPWISRHVRFGHDRARIEQVQPLPRVGVLAADAREIGTGALRAPLERPVVHRLGGDRVVAVALRLGTQRADHLRVAQIAALAHVDVLAGEAQRVVRLDPRRRRDRVRLDEQRRDLGQAARATP